MLAQDGADEDAEVGESSTRGRAGRWVWARQWARVGGGRRGWLPLRGEAVDGFGELGELEELDQERRGAARRMSPPRRRRRSAKRD